MRVLFLSDNYPPEVNAPAVRTHFHCKTWVQAGAEVTVITTVPNFPQGIPYEGYSNRLFQREVIDGVSVLRVWSYMARNAGFGRRVVDFLSYSGMAAAVGLAKRFDILLATSPQFFTALAGFFVATMKKKPWVFEVRDLWPESIVATGAMQRSYLIDVLERLELALYNSASSVVPVTYSFERILQARGIPPQKIQVITNGVDRAEFQGVAHEPAWPPKEDRPFRVGYLGTHGLAHGLDLVIRAALLLPSMDVEFVLVGDGSEKPRLQREVEHLGLRNVRLEPPVPRHQIPHVLRSFDAALVPLRATETFRSVIPSKIFEAAAAGRPVLLGVLGEAEALILKYNAGLVFRPEREDDLLEAILRLRQDSALYQALRDGGQRLAGDFDRESLARKMLGHLQAVVKRGIVD